nr:MgtC/SapB family protein [Deinobacterium chartae]
MLLGGLIGLERELANKPAGFRTHMLIAGTTALMAGLGLLLLQNFGNVVEGDLIRTDPIRILEATVAGVSFLGAGVIFRSRSSSPEGLTTAASILLAAGLGVAVALHAYVVAVGVTLLALLVLRALHSLERRIHKN